MYYKILVFAVLLLSGCASMQTPQETNTTVSMLLNEIQIAVNEIDKKAQATPGLPPFKKAEVKLSTTVSENGDLSGALVVSGETSKSSANSSILTLELVPTIAGPEAGVKSTGHEIADHVIAAVDAVNQNGTLRLSSLSVEAGLEIKKKDGVGVNVELIGISIEGERSKESKNSNNIKLVFAQ